MATTSGTAGVGTGWAAKGALPLAMAAAAARRIAAGLEEDWSLGHHPAGELLAVLAFVALVAAVLAGAALVLLGSPAVAGLPIGVRAALCAAAGAGLGCIVYGVCVEPYAVCVRRVEIESAKVAGAPLRLVHLSDLHVRRWSRLEDRVLAEVRKLQPDLILLTGDYAGFPGKTEDAERMLIRLAEIAPAYAVRGNTDVRGGLPGPSDGGPTWLLNRLREVEVRGTPIGLYGIDPGAQWRVWEFAKGLDRKRLNICLYHYPDLIPNLSACPYDLMLAGHTHGGQVRLPWIGALTSLSRAGTRYARGLFQHEGRSAFVSQGIGCESLLPRMRFLCPPEIALITLRAYPNTGIPLREPRPGRMRARDDAGVRKVSLVKLLPNSNNLTGDTLRLRGRRRNEAGGPVSALPSADTMSPSATSY